MSSALDITHAERWSLFEKTERMSELIAQTVERLHDEHKKEKEEEKEGRKVGELPAGGGRLPKCGGNRRHVDVARIRKVARASHKVGDHLKGGAWTITGEMAGALQAITHSLSFDTISLFFSSCRPEKRRKPKSSPL